MVFGVRSWLGFAVVATLAACGGGGGGGGSSGPSTVASANPFNLQSGLATLAANGFSKTFTISGSCTGTYTLTDSAASTVAAFESTTSALSASETGTLNLFGCTSGTSSGVRYYTTSYTPLGAIFSGSYSVVAITQAFPAAAHVGDTQVYGHVDVYTDSTKTTPTGSQTLSFSVTADTATTAILNLTYKSYNTSNVLTSTEQDFFRISAAGALTPIGLDILYTNGTHLAGS